MRELRVLWRAFTTTLQTRMEYRADLALGLIGAFGWQAAGLSMLWVVLHSQGGSLAGWQPKEIGLIFGLTAMIQGCSELFFNHIWMTPIYVIRGQFDRLLCYPVRSLPFFLLTSPELHSLGNLAGGAGLFLYCHHSLGLSWATLPMVPVWVLCGSIVHTSFLVLCASLIFKVKGQNFQFLWFVNSVMQSSRYPQIIYPAWLQGTLMFVIPFGTANFLPASALTGRLSWPPAILGPLAAALACGWLAWNAWDKAFEGYESTGS